MLPLLHYAFKRDPYRIVAFLPQGGGLVTWFEYAGGAPVGPGALALYRDEMAAFWPGMGLFLLAHGMPFATAEDTEDKMWSQREAVDLGPAGACVAAWAHRPPPDSIRVPRRAFATLLKHHAAYAE